MSDKLICGDINFLFVDQITETTSTMQKLSMYIYIANGLSLLQPLKNEINDISG